MSNRDKEDIIKSKEDFKPGDDDCTSCSGIALFASKDARWTKDSNWCIGVRRSVKAKIILPTHQPDTESFGTEQKKVILIGHSISSKWMDRNEYPPIILLGTSLTFGTETNASSGKQPGPNIGNDESFVLSNEKKVPDRKLQPTEIVDEKPKVHISVEAVVLRCQRMLESGSAKQIKAMNNLYKKVFSRDFYTKFTRSTSALYSSCGKTSGYFMKDIWSIITWGK